MNYNINHVFSRPINAFKVRITYLFYVNEPTEQRCNTYWEMHWGYLPTHKPNNARSILKYVHTYIYIYIYPHTNRTIHDIYVETNIKVTKWINLIWLRIFTKYKHITLSGNTPLTLIVAYTLEWHHMAIWRHHAITRTNIKFSLVWFCSIHVIAISRWVFDLFLARAWKLYFKNDCHIPSE